MTMPSPGEQWQAEYETKLRDTEQRAERMQQELGDIQITQHGMNGQVTVTVNASGNLVGLELGNSLRDRDGHAVAQEVLRLVAAAQSRIADEVQRVSEPLLGDTEALHVVVDKVRSAYPETPPEDYRPGGGGYGQEDDSIIRGTQPPPPPSNRRPRPPAAVGPNDDDYFDNGGFLR
ncbi:YbaB/EbfC family nucleoid-associated protein [Actinocrispum wychmicini]|uniref:DNA-binding protein YbaB n=1 Tax=Actinocrispum wychmicini TaxID=1213861 RepID=A0A4R2K6T7_9PSEU|nr:YbaB/EbfC family nucleoid-associated protein [Actinocrispum wychmicini]TCO65666.1 DNA-binding protein YbaB [Actinocrispum wychmicini]